ncbi:MAG: GDP-mannose 4,6-dehydratase [Thermoplasmata archaeon]
MVTLVTGSAGFIGFHIVRSLLEEGEEIVGVDNVNEYYSPKLKWDRTSVLQDYPGFSFHHLDVCQHDTLLSIVRNKGIHRICHLAAQAGVRHSIEDPFTYQRSNLEAFTSILEVARRADINNFVFASSSSVYGGNKNIPYSTDADITTPISFYAATKAANEIMAHSYHHLYGIPSTGLRFFTVYGPWGRPDMALFKFTDRIVKGVSIDVYNRGDLRRDFTYIDDIVNGVISSLDTPFDFEIFNLGSHRPVELMYFIDVLEDVLGRKAKKKMLPMQPGDVKETYADIDKSRDMLGFEPKVSIEEGIKRFLSWYGDYYGVKIPLEKCDRNTS